MSVYTKLILTGDGLFHPWLGLDIVQVQYIAAVIANKMGMGRGVSIKALLPLNNTHTLNHSVLLKKVQIAIDGSKTQIRMGGF